MTKKLTQEEYLSRARKVHGNKFDYSKLQYVNAETKVCVICNKCGDEFWVLPYSHLSGIGCASCSGTKKLTREKFIEKANIIHKNKYDYSLVEYINNRTAVKIICPKHGIFELTPKNHLYGCVCPLCSKTKKSNKEEFANKANIVHNGIYDYAKVEYINSMTKVEIVCPKHGSFWQTPTDHLSGYGCPICKASHGELSIKNFLDSKKIIYQSQYSVHLDKQMFSRNNLKVDFYLPYYNAFIEFNGIQHYKYNSFFHRDKDTFKIQIERDKRLKEYCKKNKINLIVIKYNQINKIDEILNNKLKL